MTTGPDMVDFSGWHLDGCPAHQRLPCTCGRPGKPVPVEDVPFLIPLETMFGAREWKDHWRWCRDPGPHPGHQARFDDPDWLGIAWCPGYPPGTPDPEFVVGQWTEDQVVADMATAADELVKLQAEAAAYFVATTMLRTLYRRMAADRERWANNGQDPCAVARAVAYQTDMTAVHQIIDAIETTAGGRS